MTPGEELASLRIPVTRTLVVAGAIATRDHQDVHHDHEAAQAKGSPDVFLNILTTNGLVSRYVTELLGPGTRLRAVRIRLGAPAHPGDELTFTGRVAAVDGDSVTVTVTGTTKRGARHVHGTVRAVIA